jgi:NADH:ubiquinone oxidoreductase subunit F (NADH-binding)
MASIEGAAASQAKAAFRSSRLFKAPTFINNVETCELPRSAERQ